MTAKLLLKQYGNQLLGRQIITVPMGQWPGGVAEIVKLRPDENAPEIVFEVRKHFEDSVAEELRKKQGETVFQGNTWTIGVFDVEEVELLPLTLSLDDAKENLFEGEVVGVMFERIPNDGITRVCDMSRAEAIRFLNNAARIGVSGPVAIAKGYGMLVPVMNKRLGAGNLFLQTKLSMFEPENLANGKTHHSNRGREKQVRNRLLPGPGEL